MLARTAAKAAVSRPRGASVCPTDGSGRHICVIPISADFWRLLIQGAIRPSGRTILRERRWTQWANALNWSGGVSHVQIAEVKRENLWRLEALQASSGFDQQAQIMGAQKGDSSEGRIQEIGHRPHATREGREQRDWFQTQIEARK